MYIYIYHIISRFRFFSTPKKIGFDVSFPAPDLGHLSLWLDRPAGGRVVGYGQHFQRLGCSAGDDVSGGEVHHPQLTNPLSPLSTKPRPPRFLVFGWGFSNRGKGFIWMNHFFFQRGGSTTNQNWSREAARAVIDSTRDEATKTETPSDMGGSDDFATKRMDQNGSNMGSNAPRNLSNQSWYLTVDSQRWFLWDNVKPVFS